MLTTTSYASANFNDWTATAQYVLFLTMFIGGMAGSTAGCIKLFRWLIIFKSMKRELVTTIHPEVVQPIRIAGEVIDEDAIRGVYVFTVIYFVLFLVATLFVIEDGSTCRPVARRVRIAERYRRDVGEHRARVRSRRADGELRTLPGHDETADGLPDGGRAPGDRAGPGAVHASFWQ